MTRRTETVTYTVWDVCKLKDIPDKKQIIINDNVWDMCIICYDDYKRVTEFLEMAGVKVEYRIRGSKK